MKVIRQADKYQLLHEPLHGLFRVTDGIDLSDWFGTQTRNELMALPIYKFTKKCEKLIKNSLVK